MAIRPYMRRIKPVTSLHIQTGKTGELEGVSYLKKMRYKIIQINYRTPFGEIDCIAKQGKSLVFIEIKTRRGEGFGFPEEAVTREKRRHLIRSAQYYLKAKRALDCRARFDVLAVIMGESGELVFRLIQNAFDCDEE